MFHGQLDPHVARGVQELRDRIEDAGIPPSKLDETLNVATWNIREFGKVRRSEAAVHYIAEILYQFDLVAITELRDDLGDLERLMRLLGPYWRAIFSDFNTDAAGNRERIAYLYDSRAAVFTGLAAESDPIRTRDEASGEYLPTITWWRSPFMASFRAGNFDFVLLSAHVRWGHGVGHRRPELEMLADWVEDRRQETHVVDKDLMLMGDFNIPSRRSSLYRAITKHGLEMPKSLAGTEHGSNLARDKRYDQILHYRQHTDVFTTFGGVLDFYHDDWRALFPAQHYPDMDKTAFTYELSDHLPLWVHIDTWIEDEQLDQMLSPRERRTPAAAQ